MSAGLGERVFLDACVLFPALVRSLVLSMAAEGLYTPLWSARVLEEWRRAAEHKQRAGSEAEAAAKRMKDAFPEAEVPSAPELEASITLPDPADVHVLAAAAAAGATTLLTFNLRDFPARVLAGHGVTVRHPDGFLWEALSHDPARMTALTKGVLAGFEVEPGRERAVLKNARLPRFAKALTNGNEPR